MTFGKLSKPYSVLVQETFLLLSTDVGMELETCIDKSTLLLSSHVGTEGVQSRPVRGQWLNAILKF